VKIRFLILSQRKISSSFVDFDTLIWPLLII
jgi:hypothetical protein